MKRSKRLTILLGVLVVACAATFVLSQYEQRQEEIRNSDEVVLELDTDTVQSLSWEYDARTLAFHKEDDGWQYDDDAEFPVDADKIQEMLSRFAEFGVSFIIEEPEDLGQYGLDDPVCTITITTEDQTYDILLGDYSQMDEERYVSIGDGNVYLVQSDPLDDFDAPLSEMIDNDETPDVQQVDSITFWGAAEYEITYDADSDASYCADDVYFTQQDGETVPLDTEQVDNYLQAISDLDLTNYMTYKATDEDLQIYGLDDPELTVQVDYTEEDDDGNETQNSFVLHLSRDPEEREKAQEEAESDTESTETDEEETITAYVRVGESPILYKITQEEYYALIAATYNDLRHREVLTADFADINQVDITLEGETYTITTEGDADDRTYSYGDEEIDITEFQDALTSLSANSFTDEEPDQKEEISLTVHLDNENHPSVSIALYRYDGNNCLAVVDGKPVSLIGRSYVVDLIEAVNAIVLN